MNTLTWLYAFVALAMPTPSDRWLEIRIDGTPAGYQHIHTESLAGGQLRTIDELHIVFNRLGSRSELKTKIESIENAVGSLVSVREEMTQSEQTVVTEAEIHGNEIQTRSRSGSDWYTRSIPLNGPLCGPAAFARMTHERLQKPGDSVMCRLYQPDAGPSRTTRTLLEKIEVHGEDVRRVMVKAGDRESGPVWLFDREGMLLESERQLAGMKMVSRRADRETALKSASGYELASDVVDRTSVRANIRLADARSLERIKLKITHRKPELGWPAFRGPAQRVVDRTPSTVILEVVRPELQPGRDDAAQAKYMVPNRYLQSDDPQVVRLARDVTGDEHEPFKIARRLQDWVAHEMTSDTGMGLTPASEVVRNRRGTCGAYAVLLASMARAVGIPSRIAWGYIYAAGVWASHVWIEMLVDGQWLPLDAAGYRPGIADAARFQFDSYTLEDGAAAAYRSAALMYGNIDVEILEYSVEGKSFLVPPSPARYAVSDTEYRNPWLGFSLRKPSGFAFDKLDAMYPDFTMLELRRGSSKATVSLLEVLPDLRTSISLNEVAPGRAPSPAKLDGRDAILVSTPEKARLISRGGESLWVITAEGQDPAGLLNEVIEGWKWISPE